MVKEGPNPTQKPSDSVEAGLTCRMESRHQQSMQILC